MSTQKMHFICCVLVFFIFTPIVLTAQNPTIIIGTGVANRTIAVGDSISIWWNVKDAKQFYCNELGEDKLPMEGVVFVSPTKETKYEFIAEKRGKTTKKRITIDVVYPQITSFTVPETINDEDKYWIEWSTFACDYVMIKGFDEKLPIEGRLPFRSTKDTIIEIIGYSEHGHSVSQKSKVTVEYIEDLYYPQNVAVRAPATIKWKFKNTKHVELEGYAGSLPPIGEYNILLMQPITFDIIVYRNNGKTERIPISINAYKSKINQFTGNNMVFKGSPTTLTWNVEKADSVTLSCDPGIKHELIGNYTLTPKEDMMVTLNAYLNGVKESKSLDIKIIKRKYITDATNFSEVEEKTRFDYEIFSIDVSEYPVITLYVLVVDENGRYVHGLAPPTITPEDARKYFISLVENYNNGGRAKIDNFSVKEIKNNNDIPKDISMVLDYSGSMYSDIDFLEDAAKVLIRNKRPIDAISLIKFDENIVVESKPTTDKIYLLDSIKYNGLENFGGLTALYAAMGEGMNSISTSDKPKELIVFTDGYENSSIYYIGEQPVSAEGVSKMANEQNVKMNIISLGECVNHQLLQVMAEYLGGNYYNLKSPNEILGVMSELPFLNANYYEIKFTSQSPKDLSGIQLTYSNNLNSMNFANRNIHINDSIDFFKMESDSNSYWVFHSSKYKGKHPLSTPQVIALYDLNGAVLDTLYHDKIKDIADILKDNENISVAIIGHTDQVDTEKYNLKLSERRCNSVKNLLIKLGINDDRIITLPLGEEYPLWPDEETEWQANENRRVEAVLLE
ncbi:MAG TPA: OmpA family protein [Bacteroidales bacterium]|nr:OmpA family protein [Bacteroidales bacterium]